MAAFNLTRALRQLHLYLGMLIAPSILFFAASGAVQVFGLHEAHRDTGYAPPPVVEKLSEVHIHQRYALKPKKPAPPGAKRAAAKPAAAAPNEPEAISPIKWVFAAVAVGLILSTLLGLWMGLTQTRDRRLALALLGLGVLVPLLLLALG